MCETRERFVKAVMETTLPDYELEKILFYMRLLTFARRGRTISPPTPEKWQQLPFWLQWKIYVIAMFWAKVHDVNVKLLNWK